MNITKAAKLTTYNNIQYCIKGTSKKPLYRGRTHGCDPTVVKKTIAILIQPGTNAFLYKFCARPKLHTPNFKLKKHCCFRNGSAFFTALFDGYAVSFIVNINKKLLLYAMKYYAAIFAVFVEKSPLIIV